MSHYILVILITFPVLYAILGSSKFHLITRFCGILCKKFPKPDFKKNIFFILFLVPKRIMIISQNVSGLLFREMSRSSNHSFYFYCGSSSFSEYSCRFGSLGVGFDTKLYLLGYSRSGWPRPGRAMSTIFRRPHLG